ncbi:MAG: alpha/beta hydrolase, partial [Solobacterium sp.]|nr:alpha/beta hydrolase [Solobacterium sp.]
MKKIEQIYGVKTAYITEGEGLDMILLHGWGQNKEMMQAIFDHYKDRYRVFAIDFPGFG